MIYRVIKFRTFKHFLKFILDAKFNPKYWTCLEFFGWYGSPSLLQMSYFHKFGEFSQAMSTILPKNICPCFNKLLNHRKKIGLVGTLTSDFTFTRPKLQHFAETLARLCTFPSTYLEGQNLHGTLYTSSPTSFGI